MTHDELADQIGDLIREAHARINANGTARQRLYISMIHEYATRLRDNLAGNGMIQPMSGGDPDKPPEEP